MSTRSHSRDAMRPEFCWKPCPRNIEGAGKTGCAPHPRSHVRVCKQKCAHEHTGLAEASGLPCATALRLIRDRPGDPAFRDTIALGQLSRPSDLTPASGRRTQSTSPYAKAALVSRCLCVHRISPHVVTIASAPLIAGDGRSYASDLLDGATKIFSRERLDTPNQVESIQEIFLLAQGCFIAFCSDGTAPASGFAPRTHSRPRATCFSPSANGPATAALPFGREPAAMSEIKGRTTIARHGGCAP